MILVVKEMLNKETEVEASTTHMLLEKKDLNKEMIIYTCIKI